MKKLIISIIIILLLGTVVVYIINEQSIRSIEGEISEEEKITFLQRMKNCGFDDSWNIGIVRLNSIQFVPDPLGEKDCVVKFTVKHGDYVNGGTRSELDKDYQDASGSEVWYSWIFLIQED